MEDDTHLKNMPVNKLEKRKTSPSYCPVCKVRVQDDFSWMRHVAGKKHKKKTADAEAKRASNAASSCIDGSPIPSNEDKTSSRAAVLDQPPVNSIKNKSGQVASGSSSGSADFIPSRPIPSVRRAHRCNLCEINCKDATELMRHKSGRGHKRAVRLARKGARSMTHYLAFAISSDARPLFSIEIDSDDKHNEADMKIKPLQKFGDLGPQDDIAQPKTILDTDPVLVGLISDLRKKLDSQEDRLMWNEFLQAVSCGTGRVLALEREMEWEDAAYQDEGDAISGMDPMGLADVWSDMN